MIRGYFVDDSRLRGFFVFTSWLLSGYFVSTSWLLRGYFVAKSWIVRGYFVATSCLLRGFVPNSWLCKIIRGFRKQLLGLWIATVSCLLLCLVALRHAQM